MFDTNMLQRVMMHIVWTVMMIMPYAQHVKMDTIKQMMLHAMVGSLNTHYNNIFIRTHCQSLSKK